MLIAVVDNQGASSPLQALGTPSPTNLADKLIQIQTEKPALRNTWIRSICFASFGAGVETIAITVSALFNFMLSHPGCQERIQQEIPRQGSVAR